MEKGEGGQQDVLLGNWDDGASDGPNRSPHELVSAAPGYETSGEGVDAGSYHRIGEEDGAAEHDGTGEADETAAAAADGASYVMQGDDARVGGNRLGGERDTVADEWHGNGYKFGEEDAVAESNISGEGGARSWEDGEMAPSADDGMPREIAAEGNGSAEEEDIVEELEASLGNGVGYGEDIFIPAGEAGTNGHSGTEAADAGYNIEGAQAGDVGDHSGGGGDAVSEVGDEGDAGRSTFDPVQADVPPAYAMAEGGINEGTAVPPEDHDIAKGGAGGLTEEAAHGTMGLGASDLTSPALMPETVRSQDWDGVGRQQGAGQTKEEALLEGVEGKGTSSAALPSTPDVDRLEDASKPFPQVYIYELKQACLTGGLYSIERTLPIHLRESPHYTADIASADLFLVPAQPYCNLPQGSVTSAEYIERVLDTEVKPLGYWEALKHRHIWIFAADHGFCGFGGPGLVGVHAVKDSIIISPWGLKHEEHLVDFYSPTESRARPTGPNALPCHVPGKDLVVPPGVPPSGPPQLCPMRECPPGFQLHIDGIEFLWHPLSWCI